MRSRKRVCVVSAGVAVEVFEEVADEMFEGVADEVSEGVVDEVWRLDCEEGGWFARRAVGLHVGVAVGMALG